MSILLSQSTLDLIFFLTNIREINTLILPGILRRLRNMGHAELADRIMTEITMRKHSEYQLLAAL